MLCAPLIEMMFYTNAGAVAFLRTSYSNEFRYKSVEERIRNIDKPTVKRGKEFAARLSLPPNPNRCLKLPDTEECGIGLKLYFFSLRYFAVVFLLLSIVSAGQLTVNYMDNYYGEGNSNLYAHLGGSMGGVEGFKQPNNCTKILQEMPPTSSGVNQGNPSTMNLDDLQSDYEDLMKIRQVEVGVDAGYTFLFLLSILFYTIWIRRKVRKERTQRPTLADYSLKFTQLPEKRVGKLALMLEQVNIRVHEIEPIRHINRLNVYIRYLKQMEKSEFLQQLIDNEKKCSFYDMARALKKCHEFHGELAHEDQMEPGHSAIIVFQSQADRRLALKIFHKNWFSSLLVKLSVWWLKLRHREAEREEKWLREVNVKSVPTPEDIYWENIRKKRWLLRIKLYALAIFIILGSTAVIFALKFLQTKIRDDKRERCEETCKCQYQCEDDYCLCILYDTNCDSSNAKSTGVATLQILIGLAIILVNSFLPWALGKITSNEKQSSKPRRKLSAMLKIFFALLINTSFVILVVNANFQTFNVNEMYRKEDKGHKDFTREWYADVGFAIMISMFFSIFTPHLVMCVYYILKQKCLRCMISFFDTQLAYNNWIIGNDIDLPLKTAMELVVIFGCFMYAGGMPLMLPICACALLVISIAEKYMLKYCERPIERSTILHAWFLKILPWAIVVHSMFSIYMYGADIFPKYSPKTYAHIEELHTSGSTVYDFNITDYLSKSTRDYEDRADDYSGAVFFALMGLAILVPLVSLLVPTRPNAWTVGQNGGMQVNDAMNHENFFGGRSYTVANNKNYRDIVRTMYEVALIPDDEADIEALPQESPPLLLSKITDDSDGPIIPEEEKTEEDLVRYFQP